MSVPRPPNSWSASIITVSCAMTKKSAAPWFQLLLDRSAFPPPDCADRRSGGSPRSRGGSFACAPFSSAPWPIRVIPPFSAPSYPMHCFKPVKSFASCT